MRRRVGPGSCKDGQPRHPRARVRTIDYRYAVTRNAAGSVTRVRKSETSLLVCDDCQARWRTSAGYVWEAFVRAATR